MVQEETRLSRRGLIAVALLLVLVVAFLAVRGGVFISRISSSGLGGLWGLFGSSAVQQKLDQGRRVNFLLVGYPGGADQGGDDFNTDSIMVVSLDPKTGQTAYISVPRDIEAKIYGFANPSLYIQDKINAAFHIGYAPQDWGSAYKRKYATSDRRDGALHVADDVISQFTGLTIDYNVAIDYGGFDKLIDGLGGLNINVPESFSIDFPLGRNGWQTTYFQAGPQHMSGARTLIYVRARYTACSESGWWTYKNGQRLCGGHPWTDANERESSDFARAQRQQQVIEAFRKQAVKLNAIVHLPQIMSDLEQDVRTDLSVPSDVQALWSDQGKLRKGGVLHISLNSGNLLYSCTCDQNGYTLHAYGDGAMLQAYLAALFQGPATKEKAPIKLVDASGDGGQLSAVWKDLLGQMGFQGVSDAGPGPRSASTSLVDGTGGKAKQTAAFLSSFFKAQPGTQAPTAGTVTLVLGRDAYTAFYAGGARSSSGSGGGGVTATGASASTSRAGSGGGGSGGSGGGSGGGGHSPLPVPLPSLLPSPPFRKP